MIIYIVSSGIIIAKIPEDQPYDYLYEEEEIDSLILPSYPENIFDYRVLNKVLTKLTDEELSELKVYNRILSGEERFENQMLNKLKPSHEEVTKAENTIEILSLLSEVL